MVDLVQQLTLDALMAFVSGESEAASRPIKTTDLLRETLALNSLRLLMVISHVADQMNLDLVEFADVDFHGLESVADLIEVFDSVSK